MKKITVGDTFNIFILLMASLALMFIDNNMVFVAFCSTAMYLNVIYYFLRAIRDLRKNLVLAMFNFTFFLFVTGGYSISLISGKGLSYFANSYFTASDAAIRHAVFCAYLSIATINIMHSIFTRQQPAISDTTDQYRTDHNVRFVSGIFLTISFTAKLVYELIKACDLIRAGYYEYILYTSPLPNLAQYIASCYYILLFIYLANLPTKRRVLLACTSYGAIAIAMLMYGERSEPLCVILAFIYYYFSFFKAKTQRLDTRPKFRKAILIIAALFASIYMLQLVQNLRDNTVSGGFLTMVETFFFNQGGSIKIVANSYDLKDKITALGGKSFTFGVVRNYLTQNVVSRTLFGIRKITLHSAEWALSGNSFAASYGLAYSHIIYNNGRGSGTTYLAELYHDFNLFGVILGSILIAFLISKAEKIKTSWLSMAIMLSIVRLLVYLPRDAFFSFLTATFSIQNLILLGVLSLFQKNREGRIRS